MAIFDITIAFSVSGTQATQRAKAAICSEKQRLSDSLVARIRDVMVLHDWECASLKEGRGGLDRFDVALKLARIRRDDAKRLYLIHVWAHGC